MALPNENVGINHLANNFRSTQSEQLHAIWHKINKSTIFHTFTQCTAGGDTVLVITTINNKTGVPIKNTYWNVDLTPYVGDPTLLVTC